MRPLYETKQDLHNEQQVADILSLEWGVEVVKLPIKYGADYGIYKGGILRGWMEIKCRNVPSTKYPDVILSVEKWSKAMHFAQMTASKFILVVAFTDGIFYSEESKQQYRDAHYGGRTDRKDWQDMEPVVRIPIEDFKRVVQ